MIVRPTNKWRMKEKKKEIWVGAVREPKTWGMTPAKWWGVTQRKKQRTQGQQHHHRYPLPSWRGDETIGGEPRKPTTPINPPSSEAQKHASLLHGLMLEKKKKEGTGLEGYAASWCVPLPSWRGDETFSGEPRKTHHSPPSSGVLPFSSSSWQHPP